MKTGKIEAAISQWSREFGVRLTAVQHMGLQLALRNGHEPPPNVDIINSAADATMSPDEREAFDKFSDDTKQRLLNQILKRATPQGKEPVAWMYEFNGKRVFHHAQLDHLEWDSSKQDYAKGVPVFTVTRDTPSADVVDARRYRWLAESDWYVGPTPSESEAFYCNYNYDVIDLDQHIDAAIAASAPKGDGND